MFGNERVYATINLDHIQNNIKEIENHISKDSKILAVVKTDGYGHGAVPIAKELEGNDCVYGYAVATIEEAMQLRQNHLTKPVLILGYSFPSAFPRIVSNEIRATVFDWDSAVLLNEEALKQRKKAKIHLKVDTGMMRIGMTPDEEGVQLSKKIALLPWLEIEGVFTHFARADEQEKQPVKEQIRKFLDFVTALKKEGLQPPMVHCSNSAGIIDLPEVNMNLVRAGIILYGLWPSEEVSKETLQLKPVMELKSTVVFVKDVPSGTAISYGGTYITKEKKKIATVTIGYGDGYPRILSNKGYVLIRGKKASIVGRVCMDQMMVDVSDIPEVSVGDSVTLVGTDGEETISMDDFSLLSNRINYESVCDVGKRVPRIYLKDKKVISVNYDN